MKLMSLSPWRERLSIHAGAHGEVEDAATLGRRRSGDQLVHGDQGPSEVAKSFPFAGPRFGFISRILKGAPTSRS